MTDTPQETDTRLAAKRAELRAAETELKIARDDLKVVPPNLQPMAINRCAILTAKAVLLQGECFELYMAQDEETQ